MAKRSCNCDYGFFLQGHNRSYAPESVWNGVARQNTVGFVENMIPKGEKNLGSVPGTTKVVMKLHTLVSPSPRQRSQTAIKTQIVDQNYYSYRGN